MALCALPIALCCGLAAAQEAAEAVLFEPAELAHILQLSPLAPAPLDSSNRFDGQPAAERLGHFLFFDSELSTNGEVSCAVCHVPELAFSDGKPVAHTLAVGTRRTPSLWNVAQGHWFFHDGRTDSLWAQALQPIENAIEMGGDRLAVLHRIARDEPLRRAFEALSGPLPELRDAARFPAHARPDPAHPEAAHALAWRAMASDDRLAVNRSFSDLGKFIAAYERQLTRSDSAFDRFVLGLRAGSAQAPVDFPPAAQRGLRLFLGKGRCRLCHNGPNFSDGEFHALGLGARGGGMPTDPGRYGAIDGYLASEFRASGSFSDAPAGERARSAAGLVRTSANWGEFKTASLRNVAQRAPYMHAGQFDRLQQVLHFYSTLEGAAPLHQHQEQILQPRRFTAGEEEDLRQFLLTLSGQVCSSPWFEVPQGWPPPSSESVPFERNRTGGG